MKLISGCEQDGRTTHEQVPSNTRVYYLSGYVRIGCSFTWEKWYSVTVRFSTTANTIFSTGYRCRRVYFRQQRALLPEHLKL